MAAKVKMNFPGKEVDNHITRRYDIRKRLGKGAYGIVWKATDRKTNETVAVKKIFDAFRNPTDAQRTFREIMFLKAFGTHPNIITLRNIHKAKNDRDIYLVFDYMDSDLHNVIKKGNLLKDIHIRYIMYQLLKATKYIHSGDVVHRDQKPSNILIDVNCHCKLADFGLARSLNPKESLDGKGTPEIIDPSLTDYVATRWYRAPEILVASKRYTKGIDMWSLGCILAEMLLGKPLFPGSSTINQVELIMNTIPKPSKEDIEGLCSGFGVSLLERAPSGPSKPIKHLLRNVRKDALDLVEKLLVFKPSKRLSAVEALDHPYVSRFHRVKDEPSMHYRVVPPLRDDVRLGVDDYRSNLYEYMRARQTSAQQNVPTETKKDTFSPPTITRCSKMHYLYQEKHESSPKKSTLPQISRSVKEIVPRTMPTAVRRNVSAQELRPNEKQEVNLKKTTNSDCGFECQKHQTSSPQKHANLVRAVLKNSVDAKRYTTAIIPKDCLRESLHQREEDKRRAYCNHRLSTNKTQVKIKQHLVLPQYNKIVQVKIEKCMGDAPNQLSSLKHLSPYRSKLSQASITGKYIGNKA
ncbi:hypothetical protein J437_LFUL004667 [Ladona fulva]|uniref:mitogen-activated protein kinase n=1 Tax=Ladona fulva TaxID=123851 RepID=A0A8K0K3K1_LADFU|nr:hypothetical protein J437_LFUL004667 [Ladona fulva]